MNKTIFSFLFLLALNANAQFSIPAPSDADALSKLKTSDALLSELKSNGLSITDINIKLKKKEAIFLSSDEICYQIYKDSKRLEGSNYVFDYDISTKQNKNGDVYTSTGHVWYTRVEITQTTCNIQSNWKYEFSQADPFSITTKNGFLTAAMAEKLILDTIKNGFDLDNNIHKEESETKNSPGNRWREICRIDNFKTCEYDKFEYTNYNQVINKMENNKHRISFEVEIYRGWYETGALYASMYKVTKSYSLINCYFDKQKGKIVLSNIELVSDKNTTTFLDGDEYGRKPIDVYYTPLSKTKVENIRNKFEETKPSPNSILFYLSPFDEMVKELNACEKKDYDSFLAIFKKYCTQTKAENLANSLSEKYKLKFKSSAWEIKKEGNAFSCEAVCTFTHKKASTEVFRIMVAIDIMVYKDGKYWLDK